jgi:hypothetical protein
MSLTRMVFFAIVTLMLALPGRARADDADLGLVVAGIGLVGGAAIGVAGITYAVVNGTRGAREGRPGAGDLAGGYSSSLANLALGGSILSWSMSPHDSSQRLAIGLPFVAIGIADHHLGPHASAQTRTPLMGRGPTARRR